MNPYSLILDELFRRNRADSPVEQARYLASLKPAAKALWDAYRPARNNHIAVNYDNPATQAVYMLRYYPQYSLIVPCVLARLKAVEMPLFHEERISVSFLGSGPAPELLGLFCFLQQYYPSVKKVVAHLLDAAHDGWEWARAITTDVLLPAIWDKDLFEIRSDRFDLSDPASADVFQPSAPHPHFVKESTLVVMQNCLNEIPLHRRQAVRCNIISLLKSMDTGKILIAIERTGYPETIALLQDVAEQAEKEVLGAVLLPAHERLWLDCTRVLDQMPEIITASLLVRKQGYGSIGPNDDKLVCSKRVQYRRLAIRRL
jgi:hypothetical protein